MKPHANHQLLIMLVLAIVTLVAVACNSGNQRPQSASSSSFPATPATTASPSSSMGDMSTGHHEEFSQCSHRAVRSSIYRHNERASQERNPDG